MRDSIVDVKSTAMPAVVPPPASLDVVRALIHCHTVPPQEPHVHVYADDQYCMICGKDGRQ